MIQYTLRHNKSYVVHNPHFTWYCILIYSTSAWEYKNSNPENGNVWGTVYLIPNPGSWYPLVTNNSHKKLFSPPESFVLTKLWMYQGWYELYDVSHSFQRYFTIFDKVNILWLRGIKLMPVITCTILIHPIWTPQNIL